jgi:hypothetical protein
MFPYIYEPYKGSCRFISQSLRMSKDCVLFANRTEQLNQAPVDKCVFVSSSVTEEELQDSFPGIKFVLVQGTEAFELSQEAFPREAISSMLSITNWNQYRKAD